MASFSLDRVWLDGDELSIAWATLEHARNEYGLASWSAEVQLDGFPVTVDVLNLGQAAFRAHAMDGAKLSGQVIQQNVSGRRLVIDHGQRAFPVGFGVRVDGGGRIAMERRGPCRTAEVIHCVRRAVAGCLRG